MRLKVDLLPKNSYSDVVVLVDVLRASTSAAIVLEQTSPLYITPSLRAARSYAEHNPVVLIGDRQGMPPEGFNHSASPAELLSVHINRTPMISSENSPKALSQLGGARHVLLGSFYNAQAVVQEALRLANQEIAIVCAGIEGDEALEDVLCAGFLAKSIAQSRNVQLLDSAKLSMALLQAYPNLQEALLQSPTGQMLSQLKLHEDIAIASLISQSHAVPQLRSTQMWDGRPIYQFA